MKIKSLQVIVEHNGLDIPIEIPMDVFAQHFSEHVMSNWGYWPEDYIQKLKDWKPHADTPLLSVKELEQIQEKRENTISPR